MESVKILQNIRENINSSVIMREDLLDNILICLAVGGHILLEDMPGTGKTTLAKAIAASIGGSFRRIQMVPDILPSDITGINYFNQKENDFVFKPGPIFANIILADEINRASPRSQSALLECMEEHQVSVDNVTHKLLPPFLVIATQNPIENMGTFPLPEAQLDRFLMRLSIGYPSKAHESDIINMNLNNVPVQGLHEVATIKEMLEVQESLKNIILSPAVRDYIVEIIHATRSNSYIKIGASPRAGIALARAAQARALLNSREYVLPDDVKALASAVLAHRIITEDGRNTHIIAEIIDGVRSPVTE